MLDSFGRSGGGSPSIGDFTKQLLSTTKSVMSGGDRSDSGGMDKLYDAINSVAQRIDSGAASELNSARQHTQSVASLHKQMRDLNSAQKKDSGDQRSSALLKNIDRNISILLKEAKSQNTLWFGVSKFSGKAQSQIEQAIKNALGKGSTAARAGASGVGRGKGVSLTAGTGPGGTGRGRPPALPGGTGGTGGPGGPGGPGVPGMPGGGAAGMSIKAAMVWQATGFIITAAATQLAAAGKAFMNSVDLNLGQVFDGLIKDENIFKENMRQIVYQTQGLTGANRELEKEYFKIDGLVQRTGHNRSEFQRLWLQNMQRGFKLESAAEAKEMKTAKGREKLTQRHVRDMKEITVTALHTSKQTGISADNLNDMFMNMQFGMGMTSNQVQMVATGMRSIGRDLGLTGDQLGKAIANAEKLMQKMADAGTLTAEAAEGLQRTMAAATKHNVEGLAARLSEATTDFDGWLSSSDEMKRLLRLTSNQTGISMQGIMTGQQTSTEFGQRELLTGVSDTLKTTFSNIAGDLRGIAPGIQEDLEAGKLGDVIQKLNAAGRSDIAIRLEATFKRLTGVGIGEAQRTILAIEERNMSHHERMAKMQDEYNKAVANNNLSAQREIRSRMAGANMDMVSQIGRTLQAANEQGYEGAAAQEEMVRRMAGKFMQEGDSMEQAMQRAREQIPTLLNGDAIATGIQDRISQINRQGGNLDMGKLLQKYGGEFGINSMEALQDGIARGDANANAAFTAMNQAITDEERALTDPMTGMRKDLHEINELLRGWSQSILGKIGSSLLWLIGIASEILLVLGTAVGFLMGINSLFKMFTGKGLTSAIFNGTKNANNGIIRAFSGLTTKLGNLFNRIPKLISAPFQAFTKPITGLLTKVGGKGGMIAKGVTKVGLRAGMGAGRAAAAGSTAGVALAVFAVIDGAMGAWEGYENTAKNFAGALKNADGSMREATWGMKAASTYAGMLTGILDGLTLGLLDMVGLKEPLQKVLSWIYYSVIHPFEMMWEGLKEGFMEAWGQIKPSFDKVWDAFKSIGDIFDDLFKSLGEMFGMGDVEGSMDFFIKMWETTGPIFKEIGSTIGWVLGRAIEMVIPPILWFVEVLKDIFNIISGVVKFVAGIIGIIYNLGQMIFGFFTGNEDMVNKALDGLIASMKGVLEGLGQVIWGALKGIFDLTIGIIIAGVAAILAPFVDIFTPIYDAINGVKKWFYDLYIWLVGGSLIPDLINGIWEWMKKLPGIFLDALLALPGIILEGIAKVGGVIVDGLVSAVSGVGGALLDGLKAVFLDFPMWLWEQVKAGFAQIGEWILNIIPGLGDAVKGFSETAEEQAATRAAEGNSAMHAAGGLVGAGAELLKGNVGEAAGKAWESTKEIGGVVADTAVAAAEGIWEGAKAVGSAINPLNWFDEGTKKIASDGVAMLHKGEMVVPENIWSKIAAAGTGAFGGGGSIWDSISGFLTNPLGLFGSTPEIGSTPATAEEKPMSIEEMLAVIADGVWTIVDVCAKLLGAFTGETVNEALNEGIKGALEDANKDISKDVGEKLKEGVVEGNKETQKEFNEKELLTFIAKDIGRIREHLTGEYSAMSDALMSASESTEKAVESSAKDMGAFATGEVGEAITSTTIGDTNEPKSWMEEIANIWGADKFESAAQKYASGDIMGGMWDNMLGVGDAMLGPLDEIAGSAFNAIGGIGSQLSNAFGVNNLFGEAAAKDLGAFGGNEVKEASGLAGTAMAVAEEAMDSPLAGKKMPGTAGGSLGILQSINDNVYSIASNMYDLLNLVADAYGVDPSQLASAALADINAVGGEANATMMGAFNNSEVNEANEGGFLSNINNALSGAWDWFSGNTTIGSGIDNIIKNISDSWGMGGGEAAATNLGAFEKFQAANDFATEESISERMMNQFGLPGVNDIFDSVRELVKSEAYEGPETSLARSMYYENMGGEGNEGAFWNWMTKPGSAESFGDERTGGEIVSNNSMDYREVMRGQVNPQLMNAQQLATAVESRLMGAQVGGVGSGEEVANAEDSELFKMMVHFLKIIAENTTPEQFSQIVGNTRFGVPPARGSGIKRTANDLLSSYWNIQHGEGSTANVNNDGRGGK